MNKKIEIQEHQVVDQITSVMFHLKENGNITSYEAITLYGATRLAVIINRLRNRGYHIETKNVTKQNRFKNDVTYAVYTYKEPTPQTTLFEIEY